MKTPALVKRILFILSACLCLTACASTSGEPPVGEAASTSEVVPVRIDGSFLEGVGLTPTDLSQPDPADDNVTSDAPIENSSHVFHVGKIMVGVYEAAPGKVHIESSRYDEFVHILEGRLILTPDHGGRYEFEKGDSLIVPMGYRGHWEMPEKYRELVVVDTTFLTESLESQ
ncbi:MAG: cupin domain-containing protein [Myxococcota bacterium]